MYTPSKAINSIIDQLLAIDADYEVTMEVLQRQKHDYPSKLDYGLGNAGYTLNDVDSMRFFYKSLGYTTPEKKNNKTVGGYYRRQVGKAVDQLETFFIKKQQEKYQYIGNCCYADTVNHFLQVPLRDLLSIMIENSSRVHPVSPTDSQIRSWKSSLSLMKKGLQPVRECHKLAIVLEYVLPYRKNPNNCSFEEQVGVRPDVLLLSNNHIMILEFKDRELTDNNSQYFTNQARKYANRISRFHKASEGMTVETVVVFQPMKGLRAFYNGIECCSPDYLSIVIREAFRGKNHSNPDIRSWMHTTYKLD